MSQGKKMLGRRHVLPSVPASLTEIQVEGTFPTGTYLVTVHDPIASDDGDVGAALYGSFLPVPDADAFPLPDEAAYALDKRPGAVIAVRGEEGRVGLNAGRGRRVCRVVSRGDRPIQVGFMLVIWDLAGGTRDAGLQRA